MLSTAVFLLPLLCFPAIRCVPVDASPSQATSVNIVIVTQVVTSDVQVVETSTVAPPIQATTSTLQITTTAFTTLVSVVTPPPAVVTLPASSTTVNDGTSPSSSTPSPVTAKSIWSAPPQITDLSAFNISNFAYGKDNMEIVNGIPAGASATTPTTLSVATAVVESIDGSTAPPPAVLPPAWDNSSAVIQLFYPEGSVNPGSDVQGGADFYAQPIDLSQASNVSLEYSVFFPSDFDWGLAGKLPGLYGGHETCSGGDDALECFSTRLMWRGDGAGELYLYAPKDKQTAALCSTPPQSVCDADYGLSVGRGAFNFTPGAWTHVRQTVTLNTPGQQDGGFVLNVDGQEVIKRMDVFYRDVPPPPPPPPPPAPPPSPQPSPTDPPAPPQTPAPQLPPASPQPPPASPQLPGGLGGIVGILPLGPLAPLIGGVAGQLLRRTKRRSSEIRDLSELGLMPSEASSADGSVDQLANEVIASMAAMNPSDIIKMLATLTAGALPLATQSTGTPSATTPASTPEPQTEPVDSEAVGFTGLFFSSFFGGHEEKYASPQDQYTWFKDFSIAVNN